MPLAINLFGTHKRTAMALGVEDVDEIGQRIGELIKPELPVGLHSHGFVGETDTQAREDLYSDYKRMRDKIGAERGWPPLTTAHFEHEIEYGSLYVGSPVSVARKIAATVKALGVARFDLKYSAGPLSHEKMMRSIELYGRKVIPLVRDMVA